MSYYTTKNEIEEEADRWLKLIFGSRRPHRYYMELERKKIEKRIELERHAAAMLRCAEEVGYPPAELKRVPYKSEEYRMIKAVMWGALYGVQGFGRGRRIAEELRSKAFG